MILKFYPHSWLQIASGTKRIYVDPSYVEFSNGPKSVDGLPEPLEKGDLILLTHGDFDHMNPATIERLRDDHTRVLAPPPCVEALGSFVQPVSEGDRIDADGVQIEVVAARNAPGGRSTSKHHVPGESVGYVIDIGGRRIYHAGDTDVIPEMRDLGAIDVAFLPIGGVFTMDVDEAVEAALTIGPELAVPMHTRGEADPTEFVRKLEQQNAGIRAIAPAIGEPIELTERAGNGR
jgi:L-ascorbate metabolism protein UlaG (beta-lactamase superfamily)